MAYNPNDNTDNFDKAIKSLEILYELGKAGKAHELLERYISDVKRDKVRTSTIGPLEACTLPCPQAQYKEISISNYTQNRLKIVVDDGRSKIPKVEVHAEKSVYPPDDEG